MEVTKLSYIETHEERIKSLLDVTPSVYYGQQAQEKMMFYLGKKGKNLNGFYNPPTNEVYIIKVNKRAIGTLAHELRHVYQYNHKHDEYDFYEDWYGVNDPYYCCRKTELDANIFARRYCKENKLGWWIISCYTYRVCKIRSARLLQQLIPGHSCQQ